jgi:hypothetical protein
MITFLRNLFASKPPAPRTAAAYLVIVTGQGIANRRPDGATERVSFADLDSIVIETNDRGPAEPDIWWHLDGGSGARCVFPQGATGEDGVLDWALKLPDFDQSAFIEAMTSTDNRQFRCWQRGAAEAKPA